MAECKIPVASTSSEGDRYRYTPLSRPDEIRCLILECGGSDEPLACQLRHIKLGEDPFEAVSYVWGSSVKDHGILCDGLRLDITANLHQSLRQTRLGTQPRVLWADSICINQSDDAEKGHQVRLMGRIYSQAKRVLITLGSDDRSNLHSESARSIIRQTSNMVQKTLPTLDGDYDSFPHPDGDNPLLSDPRWQSVGHLTAQPWFRRGWVVQEAGLATEASLFWGIHEIHWVEFMRAYKWICYRALRISDEYNISVSELHADLFDLRFADESKTFNDQVDCYLFDVFETLNTARALQLQDKRDYIYAFITLPQATDLLSDLKISYEKTPLDVCRDVAIWYTKTHRDLAFLHYVQHDEETLAANLPSWVPQWHLNRYYLKFTNIYHDVVTIPSREIVTSRIIENSILQAKGFTIDEVDFTSPNFTLDSSLGELASVWKSFSQYRHNFAYQAFSPLLAFYETVTTCVRPFDLLTDNEALKAADEAYMRHLIGGGPLPDEPGLGEIRACARGANIDRMDSFITKMLRHRKLVLTARGYFGLVPDLTKEGDICGVIFGTKIPSILRRTARSGHYKLIGEAFLVSVSRPVRNGYPIPLRGGEDAEEDWLEWGLEEQDIFLC